MQLQFYRTKNFKSKAWKNKVMSTVEHCQSLLKEKEGRRRIAEVKKLVNLTFFKLAPQCFRIKKSPIFRKHEFALAKNQNQANFKLKQTFNFHAKINEKMFKF